jgi:radical SAM protein with 4Fe4S-binding SPASM domain
MISPRLQNRLGLLRSYLAKRSYVPGGPVTVTVECTAKCNLACPMCVRATTYFPPRDMDLSLFQKIIDDGKDCLEFAAAYGAGEPLLNPDLAQMIAYCRQRGIPTGISTNATILSETVSRNLMAAGLNCIIFAFDGATRKIYEKYRTGSDFDSVRENILRFLQIKREMHSDIFCILQMVRLRDNKHEVPDLLRMWRVKGIDAIRIKKDEVHNEECAVSKPAYRPTNRPCDLLWRGPMYIHYDGTVFPCCYIFPDEAIGNMKRLALKEIWNSDRMIQLRKAHIQGDLSGYRACQSCPATRPILALSWGSFLFNMFTVRKALPFFERMVQIRNISFFETMN